MLLLVGFLFTVVIVAAVSLLSGVTPLFFVDLPSALLILVSLVFFMLVSKSGRVVGGYITTSFKTDHEYTRTELEELRAALKTTVKFTLATGGFAFLAGIVVCLGNLGAPEKLGPNIAISLVTLIYAITISYFVFFPVQAWAENKINALGRKQPVSGNA